MGKQQVPAPGSPASGQTAPDVQHAVSVRAVSQVSVRSEQQTC